VPKPPPVEPELFTAVRGLAFAARRIERELSAMSLAQLRILTLVARDPVRASVLADGAALSRPTLTGVLEGLVAKGWITRCAVDGDKRGVTLSITTSGREAIDTAERESTSALADLLDDLPTQRRAATIVALADLTNVAKQRLVRRIAETDVPL
jgi:DNA-binding MarR family transcriptional regulator